jgi:hypothetical protein
VGQQQVPAQAFDPRAVGLEAVRLGVVGGRADETLAPLELVEELIVRACAGHACLVEPGVIEERSRRSITATRIAVDSEALQIDEIMAPATGSTARRSRNG